MAADTPCTITQIEYGLAMYFNYRNNIIVPKVSWGMLNHEADMLILNKTGYLTEIEIKRSWADFLADFRKDHQHQDEQISWRYYAVPESIVDKVKEKLQETDPHGIWGILAYVPSPDGSDCYPYLVRYPSNIKEHHPFKKLSTESQLKLARLGAMRTWPLKQKIMNLQINKR